jgi:hypothetical protein
MYPKGRSKAIMFLTDTDPRQRDDRGKYVAITFDCSRKPIRSIGVKRAPVVSAVRTCDKWE